jgi:hypothetical protein
MSHFGSRILNVELKDSELKQYKAGIRDYRGIEGTPEKKNKG